MKISYLLWDFSSTGGSIVLYNFMDNLVKRGHEVYAIFPDKSLKWEIGIWKSEIKKESNSNNKLKIISFLFNYFFIYVLNLFNLADKIKYYYRIYLMKNKINGLVKNWIESDITISTFSFTAYAGYLLSNKTISIYHMQGFEEVFFQNNMDRLIVRNTYYLPSIKISNSKWLQKLILKQFGINTYLLNPGIDLDIFNPKKVKEEKYVKKKEWTIVSYVDENRKLKGFDDSVNAIKSVREYLEQKDVKLNWKVFGFTKPINKYNTEFEYVGKLFGKELAEFYSAADIVLMTSWFESFPLPPIEAMACGSLIITTKYGTEDYVFNEYNGLVCLPRNVEEISEKIIYAIENPEKVQIMTLNAIETSKRYNWDKQTDILEDILKKSKENYIYTDFVLAKKLSIGDFDKFIHNFFE